MPRQLRSTIRKVLYSESPLILTLDLTITLTLLTLNLLTLSLTFGIVDLPNSVPVPHCLPISRTFEQQIQLNIPTKVHVKNGSLNKVHNEPEKMWQFIFEYNFG